MKNEDEGWETAEALLLTVAELTSPVMAYQNWFINFFEFIMLFEWILSKVISPHFLCQLLIWRSINKICEQWELTFKTWSSSPRLSTLGKDFVFFCYYCPWFHRSSLQGNMFIQIVGEFFCIIIHFLLISVGNLFVNNSDKIFQFIKKLRTLSLSLWICFSEKGGLFWWTTTFTNQKLLNGIFFLYLSYLLFSLYNHSEF